MLFYLLLLVDSGGIISIEFKSHYSQTPLLENINETRRWFVGPNVCCFTIATHYKQLLRSTYHKQLLHPILKKATMSNKTVSCEIFIQKIIFKIESIRKLHLHWRVWTDKWIWKWGFQTTSTMRNLKCIDRIKNREKV